MSFAESRCAGATGTHRGTRRPGGGPDRLRPGHQWSRAHDGLSQKQSIPLWLALVPVKHLKVEKQERVLLFQRRVADALNRLFGPGDASTTALVPAASQGVAQQAAYEEGLAIARMASEQALIAAQLAGEVEARVIALESAMEARLVPLEQRLLPNAVISEEQAGRISDLVKQAALRLAERAGGGKFLRDRVRATVPALRGDVI